MEDRPEVDHEAEAIANRAKAVEARVAFCQGPQDWERLEGSFVQDAVVTGWAGVSPYSSKHDPANAGFYKSQKKKAKARNKEPEMLQDIHRRPGNPVHDFRYSPKHPHLAFSSTGGVKYLEERNAKRSAHSKALIAGHLSGSLAVRAMSRGARDTTKSGLNIPTEANRKAWVTYPETFHRPKSVPPRAGPQGYSADDGYDAKVLAVGKKDDFDPKLAKARALDYKLFRACPDTRQQKERAANEKAAAYGEKVFRFMQWATNQPGRDSIAGMRHLSTVDDPQGFRVKPYDSSFQHWDAYDKATPSKNIRYRNYDNKKTLAKERGRWQMTPEYLHSCNSGFHEVDLGHTPFNPKTDSAYHARYSAPKGDR